MDKNSMLYWYPKIKDLRIPQPKTEIYMIPKSTLAKLKEENMENLRIVEVNKVASRIGFPVFCRTDQASNKHFWDKASFIEKPEDTKSHIFEVISHNLLCGIMGLPFEALVFREYVPMDSKYTAFYGNMPVNPERRYFVKNGEIVCHHAYWVMEAINNPSVKNWKALSKQMNKETKTEVKLLSHYARMVSEKFDGCWSVDFCLSKKGIWYLIDMALGKDSWHPEGCPNYKKIRITEE